MDGLLQSDGQIFVYYNYHSVPIPPERLNNLPNFITKQLDGNYTRMFVCCDVRSVSKEFAEAAGLIKNAELCHMDGTALESSICERIKWHSTIFKAVNPVIALISDSGAFGSTLTHLSRFGWKVVIFHPPNTSTSFLDYADLAIPLPLHRNGNSDILSPYDVVHSADECVLTPNVVHSVDQGLSELLHHLSSNGSSIFKNQMIYPEEKKQQNFKPIPRLPTADFNRRGKMDDMFVNMSYANAASYMVNEPPSYMNPLPQIFGNPVFSTPPPPFFCPPPPPFEEINQPTMVSGIQTNPTVTQEKKNPFRQENPFKTQTPAPNGWNSAGQIAGVKKITGGQRNPFAAIAPQKETQETFSRKEQGNQVEDSRGKFRKPAQQCPHWEERTHKETGNCSLWHPNKTCMYFPECRLGASKCGYAHPFCSNNGCSCTDKNAQFNHFVKEKFMR